MNASNTNSSHSLTKPSQPPNLRICITSSLFNLLAALALHLSSLCMAQPSTSSSLHITVRSSRHDSPYLWNQLPNSLHQLHFSPSVSVLPVHTPTTSHSVNSPLSPIPASFTPRLKSPHPDNSLLKTIASYTMPINLSERPTFLAT